MGSDNALEYMRNVLKKKIKQNLFSGDKIKSEAINAMFSPIFCDDPELLSDLEFHSGGSKWKIRNERHYFNSEVDVERSYIYAKACLFNFKEDMIESLLDFMWLKLIYEFFSNKSNPEHVSPVINRMNSNRKDIAKIFDTSGDRDFWNGGNFIVINLNMVNITMKKTLLF
ncbi:Uncharacterised protein [Klebsiella michiganensis]|nr:Uncharacterised protein [Klebsiella michiganensis]